MTHSADPYQQVRLQRFINEITDGPFGSSLTSDHYSDEGARVVRLGNIGHARFEGADVAHIPLEYYRTLRRHEVLPGDLIIAGLGDENHSVGRACVAPDLGPAIVKADCFRVRLDQSRLTHRFAAWALSSSFVADQTSTLTRGSTRARINLQVAREIQLPVPDREEQRRIADFLDAETARIDRLVAMRIDQCSLLQERRRAELSRCVTGQRTNGRVHPLLGRVEDGWAVAQLRRFIKGVDVGVVINPSTYFTTTGVPFIHGFNVRDGYIDSTNLKFMSTVSNEELRRSQVREGDVLVVRAGAPGRAAVVGPEFDGANCASVLILRRSELVEPEYLAAFFNSPAGRGQVTVSQYGAAQEVISAAQVRSFQIAVPPVTEQRARVERLVHEVAAFSRLDEALRMQIDRLAERRQALITAAVTGQFDVTTARGADLS